MRVRGARRRRTSFFFPSLSTLKTLLFFLFLYSASPFSELRPLSDSNGTFDENLLLWPPGLSCRERGALERDGSFARLEIKAWPMKLSTTAAAGRFKAAFLPLCLLISWRALWHSQRPASSLRGDLWEISLDHIPKPKVFDRFSKSDAAGPLSLMRSPTPSRRRRSLLHRPSLPLSFRSLGLTFPPRSPSLSNSHPTSSHSTGAAQGKEARPGAGRGPQGEWKKDDDDDDDWN